MRTRSLLTLLIGLGGLAAPRVSAAAGFFFTPADADLEVRSVLAGLEETAAGRTARLSVEVTGRADTLIWLVPTSTTPRDVRFVAPDRLDALEAQTEVEVTLPTSDACEVTVAPPTSSSGCACGGEGVAPTGTATVTERPEAISPITARAAATVGDPTSSEVLVVARTRDVVTRLEAAGISTSSTTEATLDLYFARGGIAVWAELPAVSGPSRLPTLELAFGPDGPLQLPLRATAPVAAPRLDVRVILQGPGPYLSESWVGIVPVAREIVYDGLGQTSFAAWVARASANGAGHFFAAEGVFDTADGVVTRLYARPGVEQLDQDPRFRPHPQSSFRAAPMLDLSDQDSLSVCNAVVPAREPSVCARTYCGRGATCLAFEGAPACDCPAGAGATRLDAPDGSPQVTCTPLRVAGLRPSAPEVCAGVDCGLGRCDARGQRPLCVCDDGAAARVDEAAPGLRCVATPAAATSHGPGGGVESRAARAAFAGVGSLAVFAGLLLLARTRPRRA